MRYTALFAALAFQTLFTVFFLADSVISVLDLRTTPIDWQIKELLDMSAALGLLIGSVLGFVAIRHTIASSKRAQAGLRAASGAFQEMLDERLDEWSLSAAERDVTILTLKGLSIREIAEARNTSEGTIKSQSNAVYRKAGVNGRNQLQSVFIDGRCHGEITASEDRRPEGRLVSSVWIEPEPRIGGPRTGDPTQVQSTLSLSSAVV